MNWLTTLFASDAGNCELPPLGVRLDRLHEVRSAAVVQEEDALAQAPQWRSPEFIPGRRTLQDVVGQPWSHLVQGQVGEQVRILEASAGTDESAVESVGVWH